MGTVIPGGKRYDFKLFIQIERQKFSSCNSERKGDGRNGNTQKYTEI